MPLSIEQLQQIAALKAEKPFTRYQTIARQYKIDTETLKYEYEVYMRQKARAEIISKLRTPLPLQQRQKKFPPPYIVESSALIIGDVHACFVDVTYLKQMLTIARKRKITTIVINGDFFDASNTKAQYADAYTPDIIEELNQARDILYHIQSQGFDKVYFTYGNHDAWMANATDLDFVSLLEVLSPPELHIFANEYPYLLMGDDIMIGHLDRYSNNAGELALQIAKSVKRHVLVHHDHIRGFQTDHTYYGISVGCMVNPEVVFYKQSGFNDFISWQRGAAIITSTSIDLYTEKEQYVSIKRS